MKRIVVLVIVALMLAACEKEPSQNKVATPGYLDYFQRDDALSGGARLIPISTTKGTFHVWTKRVGNNPKIKVLLLHGGPGATHEYFGAFDSSFPAAEIEYYYYDQLGSAFSDQPMDADLNASKARAIVETKIRDIEARIRDLQHTRDELITLGRACGCGDAQPVCRVLEQLEYGLDQGRNEEPATVGR